MPVAITRACPHCGSTFTAHRQDNIFCTRQHLHAFDYWRRTRHPETARSKELIEAYRQHRMVLRELQHLDSSSPGVARDTAVSDLPT